MHTAPVYAWQTAHSSQLTNYSLRRSVWARLLREGREESQRGKGGEEKKQKNAIKKKKEREKQRGGGYSSKTGIMCVFHVCVCVFTWGHSIDGPLLSNDMLLQPPLEREPPPLLRLPPSLRLLELDGWRKDEYTKNKTTDEIVNELGRQWDTC